MTEVRVKREFGSYTISFEEGTKSQKDYVIFLNGKQIKDAYIFEEIYKYASDSEKAKKILSEIWNLSDIPQEQEDKVYEIINKKNYGDNIKAILFAIWHRLIIDDINYPIDKGLNGRKRLLGQIYLLLAKKFGFSLPDFIYSIPEEVYKLGFPDGLTEVVKTKQWDKIYQIFKKFTEGCWNESSSQIESGI